MPTAMAATAGRVASKVAMAGCLAPVFCCSRARASFSSSFSLPPSSSEPGHAHVVEDDLGGVRRPDAVLLVLLALRQALRARRDDEARLAPAPELGVDGGHDDVDVGDAAVRDPRLGAVEHPLVGGLVVDGPGLERADVGAGVGLGHAERAELDLVGGAEALRAPTRMTCSGVPVPAMPAAARPEPKIDRPMPASPQNSSSRATGSVRPVASPIDAWAKKSKE